MKSRVLGAYFGKPDSIKNMVARKTKTVVVMALSLTMGHLLVSPSSVSSIKCVRQLVIVFEALAKAFEARFGDNRALKTLLDTFREIGEKSGQWLDDGRMVGGLLGRVVF